MNNELHIEKIQTKLGKEIIRINGYFVHSKYNPDEEAKKLAEKYYVPHHAHIVFGYGCGYLVDALLERFQFDEKLIVIDPLLDNGSVEVKETHEKLVIFNSTVIDDFDIHLRNFTQGIRTTFQVFCLSNYDKLFPNMYKTILSKVKDVQINNRTNDFTLIQYAEQWQNNFTDNLFNFTKDFNLSLLHEKYCCPIIIASGGPSLSKQLPLLKRIRNSVIVMAAGSTIRSLLAEDIYPDYVVSVEGAETNYKHFKDLLLNDTVLIYTLFNQPKVRNSFKKPGYVVNTVGWDTFARYIHEELKIELPIIIGGASVANHTFSIAQYISTGPIAFIGQDLAFTKNNATHATNNNQAEYVDEKFLKKHQAFQVEGYYGNSIWTTAPFHSMKLDFENMIRIAPPKVPFFNCTEGGVKIHGFNQISFAEFCENYVSDEKVKIQEHDPEKKISFNVKQVLQKQLNLYDKLVDILTNALGVLESNRSKTHFETRVLKKLDQTEKKSKELFEQLPIESIVSPITMRVMHGYLPKENETTEETYNRTYNQTKDLYNELIIAIKKTRKYSKEAIKKHKSEE
ncbi:motility associated factor glycosyltransferase family protein [Lysinibacillus sp. NPDC097231]|uniref:motility associated factor glycosyltransferase family protein n=1 Tax=Lysinibacillus sp. NPDC097231 TaxID=3364142 RepID=UPI00381E83E2